MNTKTMSNSSRYLLYVLIIIAAMSIIYMRLPDLADYQDQTTERKQQKNRSNIAFDYAKDERYVYINGMMINAADVNSFTVIDSVYAKDQTYVYLESQIIQGADANSFSVIDSTYAKDKKNIYHTGQPLKIREANGSLSPYYIDTASFSSIDGHYFKDKNYAYIATHDPLAIRIIKSQPQMIEIEKPSSLDSDSFVVINKNYSKDKHAVYYEDVKIMKANPNSFVVLNNDFSKDQNYVFIEDKIIFQDYALSFQNNDNSIDAVDVASFIVFNTFLAKDKDHAYFIANPFHGGNLKIIPHADVASFVALNHLNYGKDKHSVYVGSKQINASATDIEHLFFDASIDVFKDKDHAYIMKNDRLISIDGADATLHKVKKYYPEYLVDRSLVYYHKKAIKGSDSNTFHLIITERGENYYRLFADKNRIYYQDKPIQADPNAIKILNRGFFTDQQKVFFIPEKCHERAKLIRVAISDLGLAKPPNDKELSLLYFTIDSVEPQNKRPYRLGENNFEIKEIDMPSMVFIDKQLLIDKDALYYCSISIDDSPYDYNRRYNDQELNPVIVNSIQ